MLETAPKEPLSTPEKKESEKVWSPKTQGKGYDSAHRQKVHQRVQEDAKRVEELEREVLRLREELAYESLTGLHNLRSTAGKRELTSRLDLLERRENPPEVVFMYIDFDGLHPANKLYGTHGADRLLKLFGGVLNNCCRDSDFPFREGSSGDEFGVVFFGIPFSELPEKVKEINEEFTKGLEKLDDDEDFNQTTELPKNVVSFSAGITKVGLDTLQSSRGSYFEYERIFGKNGLKARAERMYQDAKKAGSNRYIIDDNPNPVEIRKGFVPPGRNAHDNIPGKVEGDDGSKGGRMISFVRGLLK